VPSQNPAVGYPDMATVSTCAVRGVKVPAAGEVDKVPQAAELAATKSTPTSAPHKGRVSAFEPLSCTRKSLPPKANGDVAQFGAAAPARPRFTVRQGVLGIFSPKPGVRRGP
jgi:hypothetical protein